MLHDNPFNIAKNPKYYGYQRSLTSMVYKFFDKPTSALRSQSEILPTRASSDIKN